MPALPATRWLHRPPGEAVGQAVFLAISLAEAASPGGWDRHRHAEHEIIIAERGDYRCMLNGQLLVLAAGEALVVKPGDWHEDLLQAGTVYHALWFRLPGGLFAPGVPAGSQVSRPGPALLAAVGGLERLAEAGARPARLDAALAAIIGLLVDGLPGEALAPAFSADHGFAARLQALFARLPPGPASAAAIARAMGLSRRTLERQCRDGLGCGPVQAHARWRVQRAGELLRTTDWPVRAVSATLGFANQFHFSRAFARVHGAAPTAWRLSGGNPSAPPPARRGAPV
jgi:AraC-like DNA-binding protein